MTPEEIRGIIVDTLGNIAPEADASGLDPKADIRESLDIDSLDFLNFVIALHGQLHVDIPEIDYPKLFTLGGAVAYLMEKTAPRK
ncbi:MAG: acyl carrier protein [Acidobacteriota bacterium]